MSNKFAPSLLCFSLSPFLFLLQMSYLVFAVVSQNSIFASFPLLCLQVSISGAAAASRSSHHLAASPFPHAIKVSRQRKLFSSSFPSHSSLYLPAPPLSTANKPKILFVATNTTAAAPFKYSTSLLPSLSFPISLLPLHKRESFFLLLEQSMWESKACCFSLGGGEKARAVQETRADGGEKEKELLLLLLPAHPPRYQIQEQRVHSEIWVFV